MSELRKVLSEGFWVGWGGVPVLTPDSAVQTHTDPHTHQVQAHICNTHTYSSPSTHSHLQCSWQKVGEGWGGWGLGFREWTTFSFYKGLAAAVGRYVFGTIGSVAVSSHGRHLHLEPKFLLLSLL